MQYLDKIKTIPAYEANNALILGAALHTGIERGTEEAIHDYFFSYPVITDEHINEAIKLKTLISLGKNAVPSGGKYEIEIINDDYHGFIDYLYPVAGDTYDLYDFKYSNNVKTYEESSQLDIYKYFYEREKPQKRIRDLYFLVIPKVQIRQKETESLVQFRQRLRNELDKCQVKKIKIKYDYKKVEEFLLKTKEISEEKNFIQQQSQLCRFCEFQEYCEKGWTYFMILPENQRRELASVSKRVLWIYGVPFCGKTTFANSFPDPLMLNTDGNIKFVDAPYISIKDQIETEGRIVKRTMAWEIFKDAITELEKKENTFKTIVVDLLEDLYEHCRLYMYQRMNITHESDDAFRAWDKIRGEFLNTLKRLMNLDYENIILISHEDSSKDILKRSGDRITSIKPNLPEKVANKVAGMVDIVARVVADGDEHILSFKSNEVIFGGGRLKTKGENTEIPLKIDALFSIYEKTQNKPQEVAQNRRDVGVVPFDEHDELGTYEQETSEQTNETTETRLRRRVRA